MLSDRDHIFFDRMIEKVLSSIACIFGDDVQITRITRNFEHMGWFGIYAYYKPTKMLLELENESIYCFSIRILDKEGAATSLSNIETYNYKSCTTHNGEYIMECDNIVNSLLLLKNVLHRNDFPLYFSRGNKRYVKHNGVIKLRRD